MRLPIDTGTVKFAAAGPAEPLLDYETQLPKLDENGAALFHVPLFAVGTGIKDSITVKVVGPAKFWSLFTVSELLVLSDSGWIELVSGLFLSRCG